MSIPIEIIQDEYDKTDYLALIINMLNEKFTTREQMESRFVLNCLEVAESLSPELGAFSCTGDSTGSVLFDFSLNGRNKSNVN